MHIYIYTSLSLSNNETTFTIPFSYRKTNTKLAPQTLFPPSNRQPRRGCSGSSDILADYRNRISNGRVFPSPRIHGSRERRGRSPRIANPRIADKFGTLSREESCGLSAGIRGFPRRRSVTTHPTLTFLAPPYTKERMRIFYDTLASAPLPFSYPL